MGSCAKPNDQPTTKASIIVYSNNQVTNRPVTSFDQTNVYSDSPPFNSLFSHHKKKEVNSISFYYVGALGKLSLSAVIFDTHKFSI